MVGRVKLQRKTLVAVLVGRLAGGAQCLVGANQTGSPDTSDGISFGCQVCTTGFAID